MKPKMLFVAGFFNIYVYTRVHIYLDAFNINVPGSFYSMLKVSILFRICCQVAVVVF